MQHAAREAGASIAGDRETCTVHAECGPLRCRAAVGYGRRRSPAAANGACRWFAVGGIFGNLVMAPRCAAVSETAKQPCHEQGSSWRLPRSRQRQAAGGGGADGLESLVAARVSAACRLPVEASRSASVRRTGRCRLASGHPSGHRYFFRTVVRVVLELTARPLL